MSFDPNASSKLEEPLVKINNIIGLPLLLTDNMGKMIYQEIYIHLEYVMLYLKI